MQQKPLKKQYSGKNTATGSKSSNKKGSPSSSQVADKKVRRLQAHNAAEKRRQQRIAQEIDHIREVLVRQEVTVGSTKRELFQKTVEHMNYLWSTIKEYQMKEAARPSPQDLRIAKMLKESCTQAMYEIDSNFTICHVFGACADITGHMDAMKQLSGKSFLECVHPDDVMRVRSYFRAVFDHKSYEDIQSLPKFRQQKDQFKHLSKCLPLHFHHVSQLCCILFNFVESMHRIPTTCQSKLIVIL